MPDPATFPVDGSDDSRHETNMDKRITRLEIQFETVIPTLATKADMAELRHDIGKEMHEIRQDIGKDMTDLRQDIGKDMTDLRQEIGKDMHEIRGDMAEIRIDMQKRDASMSKWMLSTTLVIVGTVVLGFAGMFFNLTRQAPALAQPLQPQAPPAIIYLPAQTLSSPG